MLLFNDPAPVLNPTAETLTVTPELIAIFAVGISLGGLLVGIWRGLSSSIDTIQNDISELRGEVSQLGGKVSDLGERVAKIEGSLFHPPAGGSRQGP